MTEQVFERGNEINLQDILVIVANSWRLLGFLFIRKAWTAAGKCADSASKLAAIERSLGLVKAI